MTEFLGYFTDVENVHVAEVGGSPLIVGDDFGDYLISSRDRFTSGILFPYTGFRPEWSVLNGNWNADNGYLNQITTTLAYYYIKAPSVQAYGTWICKIELVSIANYHEVVFHPIYTDPSNRYFFILQGSDSFQFGKEVGGAGTPLIGPAAWGADTGPHIMKITRASDNTWEVFIDDVSKGTVIDDEWTTATNIAVTILNTSAGLVKMDDVRCYS